MQDDWETMDVIRMHMRDYLNQIIFIMARLKRSMGEFERHFGPVNVSNMLADETYDESDESTPDRLAEVQMVVEKKSNMLKDSIKLLRSELKMILGGCYNTEPSKSKGNGTSSWGSKE